AYLIVDRRPSAPAARNLDLALGHIHREDLLVPLGEQALEPAGAAAEVDGPRVRAVHLQRCGEPRPVNLVGYLRVPLGQLGQRIEQDGHLTPMVGSMNSLVTMSAGLSPSFTGFRCPAKIGLTMSMMRCTRLRSKSPTVLLPPLPMRPFSFIAFTAYAARC